MSKLTLEGICRFHIARRARVCITKRKRSAAGFVVWHPPDARAQTQTWCASKREALACLRAKAMTTEPLLFKITVKEGA